jgi:glycosyltransferase involved in cell wall biosynthesis
MRILLLTQWFQPEPAFKGLPFAKALADKGHEVEVLTGFPNYPGGKVYPNYRVRLWQREIIDGIKVNRVALYPSHDRSATRRMLNYLSFAAFSLIIGPWMTRPPDVIYICNLITLGPTAFFLRLIYGSKVILDVLDLWPDSVALSGMLNNKPIMSLLTRVCHYVYRNANKVIALSPGVKQALIKRGVSQNKIDLIYNWCDESSVHREERNEAKARELGMNGKFNVLFAGTMGLLQGLDTILEAAHLCRKSLPHVQFVLVGGGVDRPNLEARAKDMNLDNLKFLPQQPLERMGAIFTIADVLLVHLKDDPSFRIVIPSKTQTYLYMGKPIIMAVKGDAADLVENSGAGILCEPGNPQAIADAVAKLYHMTEDGRQQMGISGLNYYMEFLSFKKGIDQFERIMRQAMAER